MCYPKVMDPFESPAGIIGVYGSTYGSGSLAVMCLGLDPIKKRDSVIGLYPDGVIGIVAAEVFWRKDDYGTTLRYVILVCEVP